MKISIFLNNIYNNEHDELKKNEKFFKYYLVNNFFF